MRGGGQLRLLDGYAQILLPIGEQHHTLGAFRRKDSLSELQGGGDVGAGADGDGGQAGEQGRFRGQALHQRFFTEQDNGSAVTLRHGLDGLGDEFFTRLALCGRDTVRHIQDEDSGQPGGAQTQLYAG